MASDRQATEGLECVADMGGKVARRIATLCAFALAMAGFAAPVAAQTCPTATDTRYVIGSTQANTATTATLTWTEGSLSRPTFTFASGFAVTLSFTNVSNLDTTQGEGWPQMANLAGVSSLEIDHNGAPGNANLSTLNIAANQPVSAQGVRVEDMDFSAGVFRDRVTASTGAAFAPVNPGNYTIAGTSIQANNGVSCTGTAGCNVQTTWGASATGATRQVTYQNGLANASGLQAIAYNDFVFCVPRTAQLTMRKAWVGAAVGDDATVTASRAGSPIVTLNSNADTAGETDASAPVAAFQGETLTLAETLAGGNAGQYAGSLACTGTTDANPSDGLTIGATDTNVVCTYTNARRPRITVTKVSNGGVGTFAFSGSNGFAAQNVTTTTAGVGVAGPTQTLTTPSTATTITESAPPSGFVLSAISCTGLGPGGTATPTINGSAGGSVLLNAAATAPGSNIACTFTNTLASADLSIVKTNATTSVTSGTTTTYTITVANAGPGSATNAIVRDTASTGLTGCVVSTPCSVTSGTATCPSAANLTYANLSSGAGVAVPSMGVNSAIQFQVTCNVQ